MNYWDLNKITVKNHHLLSLISETLNRFSKVKQFTKLNLKNVYHCFKIQCKDEWKMTFYTHYNHFEYTIMLFNLINAFVIFQTYINKILTKLLNDFYIVYLNEILIFFIKKTDHVNHMKQILERLRKFKLYVSLKKCKFFITKVNFLEFVVFTKNISMNLSRINIIKTWFRSKIYWVDWLQQVKLLRSSWIFNSSRLDSSQNFEIEYSSWVMMFELNIQIELKCWNRVLTWIFDSIRQDMKRSTTNIYLSVW